MSKNVHFVRFLDFRVFLSPISTQNCSFIFNNADCIPNLVVVEVFWKHFYARSLLKNFIKNFKTLKKLKIQSFRNGFHSEVFVFKEHVDENKNNEKKNLAVLINTARRKTVNMQLSAVGRVGLTSRKRLELTPLVKAQTAQSFQNMLRTFFMENMKKRRNTRRVPLLLEKRFKNSAIPCWVT